ncbi:peptidoglycan-binding domain-containing protein [uncultured Tateyamaria sp.]|uniref:peptidoglycan-binding domain-containing protein n=1 Tax=uncultured Tateyamaria sp. TaxID=455651 RepID=UPI0026277A0D|nr:peptidoglycan-binding domain-containing protein [uncultured Tateyamaria sp.]
MAILKKGAKGNDTKEAQKLLNKNGAKIKEDGIFGPITEAAARKIQKKLKLKPDGQIGPITMAGLKYGKPLPEMTTKDYDKFIAKMKVDWKDNYDILSIVHKTEKALSAAAADASKEIKAAIAFIKANETAMAEIAKMGDSVIAKQKEFKAKLLKDPAAAEKLAKECADLDTKLMALGKKKVSPNRTKAADALGRANTAMDTVVTTVKDCRKAVAAEKATW